MESVEAIYKVSVANAKEILAHLKECNDNFHPLLSERVDIEEYSRKIFERAVTFEAWSGNNLVGLLAAYFNDDSSHCVYITNVSVLENFMKQGVASKLLAECIEHATAEDFREIRLDVHKGNDHAIGLYRKFDFLLDEEGEDFLRMKLKLNT